MTQEVVTYNGLPTSEGGAHSLRTKNPRAAHERVQAFLDADGRFESFVAAHVQKHLPFRLSAKHWRRWRATKDGQSYRATKITSPLVS